MVATLAVVGGAASAQCPPVRFVSPDGAEAREFGAPLAMSPAGEGHRVAIGQDGSVWAFDLVDGALVGGQELTVPFVDVSFGFGGSVDIQGDRLAIGAYQVRWPGRHWSLGGSAVYDRVDGRWLFTGVLRPPPTVATASAASRPLIDGDTIIAGGGSDGTIIVYEPSAVEIDGWAPIDVVERPAGMDPGAKFGYDMAAGDGWLFVGATLDSSPGYYHAGSVSVYRRQADGTYELVQRIVGPDLAGPEEITSFGNAIGFDGSTLAVNGLLRDPAGERESVVIVFELEGGAWTPGQVLRPKTAGPFHHFGRYTIQVDGDRLVAQMWGDRTPRSDHVAVAYERTVGGVWRLSARLLPTPPYHAGQYAGQLDLVGDLLLAASSEECEGPGTPATGAAYLFDLSCYECPDLDADDRLTVFDTLEFLRAFEAGEAIADFDNDGELTVADFLAFQNAFAVGCP